MTGWGRDPCGPVIRAVCATLTADSDTPRERDDGACPWGFGPRRESETVCAHECREFHPTKIEYISSNTGHRGSGF